MFDEKKIWAIIPARKGSKRIPWKNLRPLARKPLIQWTFDSARNSKYIDRIFVSTDCEDIANYARSNDIEVPFMRPNELAKDETKTVDVLLHFFKQIPKVELPDLFILLQPTSPLRKPEHINNAIELYFNKKANSVVSLTEAPSSIFWANSLPEDLKLENFFCRGNLIRSQDLPKYYTLNGAIYIYNLKAFLKEKDIILQKNNYAFIMDKESSIDVDEFIDLDIANLILKRRLSGSCILSV